MSVPELASERAMRLHNVLAVVRRWVIKQEWENLEREARTLDATVRELFAIERDTAAALCAHILDEQDMVVVKRSDREALRGLIPELQFMASMVDVIGGGYPLTSAERRRVHQAAARIRSALEIAGQ